MIIVSNNSDARWACVQTLGVFFAATSRARRPIVTSNVWLYLTHVFQILISVGDLGIGIWLVKPSQRCMYHRSAQFPSCDSSISKLISQLTLSCVQVHLMNRNSIIGLQIPTLSTRIKVLNMPRKNRRLSTYLSDSVARKHIVCTIRLPSQRRRR